MAKKTEWTCDVCEHKTIDENKILPAYIRIADEVFRFEVCTTCWDNSPKGVFQKMFNRLVRRK